MVFFLDNEFDSVQQEHRVSTTQQPAFSHHNHHVFQHQSSVTSIASIQTVLHQTIHNTHSSNFSIQSHINQKGSLNSLAQNQTNSSDVSTAEETLNIADVADILHPQHAIITG